MKKVFFYLLLLVTTMAVQSQELLPFVENFTKSNYYGDNQVWSVAQGNDNAFYFANNHYFLRYNGVRWEKYELPNKTILRSVKLERNAIFNTNFANISEIIPINSSNLIVLKDKLLYIIHQLENKFIWELLPEKYYEGKIINQDTKVFSNGNKLLMNLDDGFFSFYLNNKDVKPQKITIEGYYQGNIIDDATYVDYNQSVIHGHIGLMEPTEMYCLLVNLIMVAI